MKNSSMKELATKVNALRHEIHEIREHGDEEMRNIQLMLSKIQTSLERRAEMPYCPYDQEVDEEEVAQ